MFALVLLAALSAGSTEREVLGEVNRYRAGRGLAALAWNEAAAEEARAHCRNLLTGPVTSPHAGFDGRVARLKKKVAFRQAAENVGLLSLRDRVGGFVVRMWSSSDTHRRNLEGPYERTGIGVVQSNGMVCATQILLGASGQ
jgi:uncharacterized protein YkwD